MRAPSDGRIARIHIREGERVERGDLLLEYDSKELLLERRTKQAELTQAREELRLLGALVHNSGRTLKESAGYVFGAKIAESMESMTYLYLCTKAACLSHQSRVITLSD